MEPKLMRIIKRITPSLFINYRRSLIKKQTLRKSKSSVSISQAGQDHWVYGEVFNETEDGYFLDIGAHDGVLLSNTFLLEKRYNWKGICIEANPNTFADLEANRDCKCINKCIDKQSGSVSFALRGVMGGIVSSDCDNRDDRKKEIVRLNTISLQQLLVQEKAPSVIDYLSIDIEGAEDRVLLGFGFDVYKFNCITIERPSKEVRKLLIDKGYILIKEIPGLDCFYIHTSFKDKYHKNLFSFNKKKFLTRRWR